MPNGQHSQNTKYGPDTFLAPTYSWMSRFKNHQPLLILTLSTSTNIKSCTFNVTFITDANTKNISL